MTNAERQRRFRERKRTEIEELYETVNRLMEENQRLTFELRAATGGYQQLQELIEALTEQNHAIREGEAWH